MKHLKNMKGIWKGINKMEKTQYSNKINYELFSQNCINGENIQNIKFLKNTFYSLVSTVGWEKLIFELTEYLTTDIKDRKSAFNFATWLFIYDFGKCCIKNPYPFFALLYKKMELDKNINDELNSRIDTPYDRFFDLYSDVLVSSNIIDINNIDYVRPDDDLALINEIKKL